MSLFKKKVKKTRTEDVVETKKSKKSKKAGGKKSKVSDLPTIIEETILDSVMVELGNNFNFTFEDGNITKYVAMYFETASIGGLGKKSKNDEDKGAIINDINGGDIHVYTPLELLEKDAFIIIPNQESMAVLDEFLIMTNNTYGVAIIDETGDYTIIPDSNIEFSRFNDISEGRALVLDLLNELGVDVDNDDLESDDQMEYENIYDSNDAFDDAYLEDDDEGVVFDEPVVETSDEIDTDPIEEPIVEPEPEVETPVEVTPELFEEAITKVFNDASLGLEYSTETFDAILLAEETPVLLPTDRPDGWLNRQINELCTIANNELKTSRQDALKEVRRIYIGLQNKGYSGVASDYDNFREGSLSYDGYQELLKSHAEKLDLAKEKAETRREELEEKFKADCEAFGERAKAEAIAKFKEENEFEHEHAMDSVESEYLAKEELQHQTNLNNFNQIVRSRAQRRWDIYQGEAEKQALDIYRMFIESEPELYNSHAAKIQKFIDENRKNDIEHTAFAKAQLEQVNLIGDLKAEHDANIESVIKEHEVKLESIKREYEEAKQRQEAFVADIKAKTALDLDMAARDRENLQESLRIMTDKYANLEERKDLEYSGKLNSTAAQNEQLLSTLQMQNITQQQSASKNSRNNVILILLVIIGMFIAVVGSGLFVMNVMEDNNDAAQSAVVAEPATTQPISIYTGSAPAESTADETNEDTTTTDTDSDSDSKTTEVASDEA